MFKEEDEGEEDKEEEEVNTNLLKKTYFCGVICFGI
jgi:hypothetical protein